jgi:DNA helicase HerA-like ATPase
VAVFYLHPRRQMFELKWNELFAKRYRIYDLLASMVEWADYDLGSDSASDSEFKRGLLPPGEPVYCSQCPYNKRCVKDLGPKNEGDRVTIWEEKLTSGGQEVREPKIERVEPEQPKEYDAGTAFQGEISKPADDLLWLGRLRSDLETRVTMPSRMLATHTAVVGAAGSGKTWLAKGIVEEAILQGIPVLAVDPQGDLVQFLRPADSSGFAVWEQKRFDRYWQTVEPRVFTPGSSHAVRLSLNPLRMPRNDQLAGIVEPMRRQEEFEGMLSAAAENLVSLAQVKGEVASQKTFLIKLLSILGKDGRVGELSMSDLIAAIRAPEDIGLENVGDYIRKSEREKLGRSLVSLMEGPAGQLFRDGLKLDIAEFRRASQSGKTPLNVIYLNAITDDSKKQFLVATLAAEIYRWMVGCSEGPGMKLLFYIDEARDYLPKGTQEVPAKQPLIRLFTQGRKYGVGCLLCTQSPRSVDYNVFGNCSTKIIGRLGTVQDVDRVDEWFNSGVGVPAWLAGRKGAKAGSFVGSWPEMDPSFGGAEFESRPLFSMHQGAWSPDRVEREMADDVRRRVAQ